MIRSKAVKEEVRGLCKELCEAEEHMRKAWWHLFSAASKASSSLYSKNVEELDVLRAEVEGIKNVTLEFSHNIRAEAAEKGVL